MTDTIDRDELLRLLTKRRAEKEHDRNLGSEFYRQGYIGGFYKQGYMDGYDDAIKAIDSILPADVETVRRGTWEWREIEYGYECSACHCFFDYTRTFGIFDHGYEYASYCPNCGAKMEDENA